MRGVPIDPLATQVGRIEERGRASTSWHLPSRADPGQAREAGLTQSSVRPGSPEPLPGERCDKCHRRVPKKRESKSPATKRIYAVLPPERAEALAEGLDNLQEYAGIDGESYPRGVLLEFLLGLGAIHREELRAYFEGQS